MGADFGFRVYATQGDVMILIGVLAYGTAVRKMRAGAFGDAGYALLEVLDSHTDIYLDNPEVVALWPQLVAADIIPQESADKIAAFVAAQLAEPPAAPDPAGSPYANHYRVPLMSVPAETSPFRWIAQQVTASCSAWISGEWLMVDTDGACTAPGAEVV